MAAGLAFAQMGQGQIPAGDGDLSDAGKIDARGRSLMTSGLSDLAHSKAVLSAERMLTQGAAADWLRKIQLAAAKFAAPR